jgi:hypothetical protein
MNRVFQDVCDVVFRRISDKKIVFTGIADTTGFKQTVKKDKVKGGIGNGDVAILRSDKEVALDITNAIMDLDWLEMSAGVSFTEKEGNVYKREKGLILTGGKVTLPTGSTPVDDKVILIDSIGKQFVAVYDDVAKTATITGGKEGDVYLALFEMEIIGSILSLDVSKFSENYYVEMSTICYNPETNEVYSDVYYQFDKCSPSSDIEMSLKAGANNQPKITIDILKNPNSTEIGRIIEIPRV